MVVVIVVVVAARIDYVYLANTNRFKLISWQVHGSTPLGTTVQESM